MKSYTDINQSRKLAEILPLESADMFWYRDAVTKEAKPRIMDYMQIPELQSMYYSPCWSLAALLDVLPIAIETHKQTDGYKVYHYVELYMKHKEKEIYLSTERHESLVDACYEMIIKLNKMGLL